MRVLFLGYDGRLGWCTALAGAASIRGARTARWSFKGEPTITGQGPSAFEGVN